MRAYSHDEIAELLGAYALDAVDADERAAVEAHLPECPRCSAEVAEHREVAALLANTGSTAPEGLWNRILGALEEPAPEYRPPTGDQPPIPEVVVPLEPRREARERQRRPMLVAAAVAGIALVVGALGAVAVVEAGDDDNAPVAQPSLEDLARDALNDEDATRVELASDDGALRADAVVTEDGRGFLLGTSLPVLDDSRTYQLWGVNGDVVVSLGVLGNSPGVVAFQAADGVDALVITDEVFGGVPSSTNPPLLAADLT